MGTMGHGVSRAVSTAVLAALAVVFAAGALFAWGEEPLVGDGGDAVQEVLQAQQTPDDATGDETAAMDEPMGLTPFDGQASAETDGTEAAEEPAADKGAYGADGEPAADGAGDAGADGTDGGLVDDGDGPVDGEAVDAQDVADKPDDPDVQSDGEIVAPDGEGLDADGEEPAASQDDGPAVFEPSQADPDGSGAEPADPDDAASGPDDPDDAAGGPADPDLAADEVADPSAEADDAESPAEGAVPDGPAESPAEGVVPDGPAEAPEEGAAEEAHVALEAKATGYWGTCYWVLGDNGTLTLYSGTGTDLGYGKAPWNGHLTSIEKVAVAANSTVVLPADTSCMFDGCSNLKEINLAQFDFSHVENMYEMFYGCSALSKLDGVTTIDVSNVKDMFGVFWECSSLTKLDLSGWDTSSATRMSRMFQGCSSLASLNLSSFDTSSVTAMHRMFDGCASLIALDLSSFDTSNVTDMSELFRNCTSLTSPGISSFDTSCATNLSAMFAGCASLVSVDLSHFDTLGVTDMSFMFARCTSLRSPGISLLDTSSVTNMKQMFYGCSALTSLDVSSFDTSSARSMTGMFVGCTSLVSLDVSGWNTSSVTRMDDMFKECSSLKSLDLSSFDTSSVEDITCMFEGCSALATLDIAGFDTSGIIWNTGMFSGCSSLASVAVGKGFAFEEGDCELPSYDIGGRKGWWSKKDQKWYTSSEIAALASRADTYVKYVDISAAKVTAPDQTYTGSALKPAVTVKIGPTKLESGTDYTVAYKDNKAVGTATVTVTGKGSYTGTVKGTFKIKAAPNGATDISGATVTCSAQTYTGLALTPAPTVKLGGKTLKAGTDYTVAYADNVKVGTAKVTVKGKGSYKGSAKGTFKISYAMSFTDVGEGDWFFDWVMRASGSGLMTGYAGTTLFGPNDPVLRAQVATVLWRMSGSPSTAYSKVFSDVPDGKYYSEAIVWCQANGIVTGYTGTGRFGPEDPVTREQLGTMVYRYAKFRGADVSASPAAFNALLEKELVSSWAHDAMVWCADRGIITGAIIDGKAYIKPQRGATRAETSKIMVVLAQDVL